MKKKQKKKPTTHITFKDAFKKKEFYMLFTMLYCSTFYGMFLLSNFKVFGSIEGGIDDFTLTLAYIVGSTLNGIFRVVCAAMLDKIGFKKIYGTLLVLQIILSATITLVVKWNKWVYVIWVATSYSCLGGNFSTFPAATSKIFGLQQGGLIYSVVFIGNGISSLTGFIINTYFTSGPGGMELVFYVASGLNAVALIILILFND